MGIFSFLQFIVVQVGCMRRDGEVQLVSWRGGGEVRLGVEVK